MKRILKRMVLTMAMGMCLFGINMQATFAATEYTDTEDNGSASSAQLISSNVMTYAQRVAGNTSLYKSVRGQLTGSADEDWYKVYLYQNRDNYFTITGGTGTMFIDILNESEETIRSFTYSSLSNAENVFNLEILRDGLYYIRLYHIVNVNSSYKFIVGNPEYYLDSYTHKFGSQTLPAKGEWENYVNLTNNNNIPVGAVGYEIVVAGCSSSVCSDRFFYNEFYKDWVATKTGYKYSLPVTESSKLAQVWGVRYESTKSSSKSFNPEFTIYYVYPDLPANEQ